MKKLLFLFLFCCPVSLLFAQQQVTIDDHVSITFPGNAESKSTQYGNMWFGPLAGDDLTKAMGMAMGIPLSSMGVDSATIAKNYADPVFIESMISGMLGKLPGVQLISRKKITKQSRKGYLLELEKDVPDEQFAYKKLYALLIFAGEQVYLQAIYAAENMDVTSAKTIFFDSFRVK